jgi:proteic killer suppression protein
VVDSFRCSDSESLAGGKTVKGFTAIEAVARRKLRRLEIAGQLQDLRVPQGNRLEALRVDRAGQHSRRVNDQSAFVFAGPQAARRIGQIVTFAAAPPAIWP